MKRYLAIILLGITVISVVLYFSISQADLREYEASEITIPNDSLAYLKNDMTLVTGIVTRKYANGQLAEQATFKNGLKDGLIKVWYKKNGQLSAEGSYKNGERNGIWKFYFENGQIKAERHYTDNGKLNGSNKTWYESGQLYNETQFIEGLEDGVAKMWYENGQLKTEFNFSNGVRNGISRMWHPNGQLGVEERVQNGVSLETISMYSEEGINLQNTPDRAVFLINGEWMLVDQDGDSGKVSFKNGTYKSFRSNGNLKETGVYNINGKQLTLVIDNGPQVVMNVDTINSESIELSLVSDVNHKIKGIKTSN